MSAVVLCWNDDDAVIALLDRLATLTPRPSRAIVVHNGSAAAVVERILALHPESDAIVLPGNRGFAAAANRGIEKALADGTEWIWLLNSDIALPTDALEHLLAAAQRDPRCGMAAAMLTEADGSLQARGGGRVNLWTGSCRNAIADHERCDYLSGACLLLRASLLADVGLFDEGYFFYWEDVDLAFRARAAGWSMAVAEDCLVEHREGSSLGRWSEKRWFFLFVGLVRFLGAHAPLPRVAIAVRLGVHSAAMLRHGRRDALRGAWRAVLGSGGNGPAADPGGPLPAAGTRPR